jgi:hypothetical protein
MLRLGGLLEVLEKLDCLKRAYSAVNHDLEAVACNHSKQAHNTHPLGYYRSTSCSPHKCVLGGVMLSDH